MSNMLQARSIYFNTLTLEHKDMIFEWLAEPHMQEFWDNSDEHKEDIINFMNGRKESSNYFAGIMTYWIGFIDNNPFCFILTSEIKSDDQSPKIWNDHISKTGVTYSIDFGIGNKEFLGKGLASSTLIAFVEFFQAKIDPKADTFFIDPDENNPRAKHVYAKAGFKLVGDFVMKRGTFQGQKTNLMLKKYESNFN